MIRGGPEEAGHARRLPAAFPDDVRRSSAARILDPPLAYDRWHRSEPVRTLGVFLDRVGLERLHVHVNTVRYRIRRVEEPTGRDLSTTADRVDLFLALQAD
ncbi:helix-turn-helix domain-containing protein [Streptosporangium sp. NPDC051022]|uniref:helix-turn-helix domain-containing protein n=1 Tax=Streptosporangium sp. NPDC051022 TaxID=3155752 RepID=UPI003426D1E7